MNSIFREKRLHFDELEINPKPNYKNPNFKMVTHDNGFPRERTYSLSSKIYFTIYSGSTIKELIETDFDYFTWLPRNIKDFRYTEDVLVYAEKCLDLLEKIENFTNTLQSELGIAINQVDAMIRYEYCLDFEDDPNLLAFYQSEININYYRKFISNTSTERLIRQAKEIEGNSSTYRRKYFQEVKSIMNY